MSYTAGSSSVSRFTSNLDLTKTQLTVVFVTMMLAVDTINPVKIVLHVFPFIQPWQVASVAFLLAIYIFLKEMKELLYFLVKTFFHSILSIFFRDVEIVGVQNIPTFGPCIFSVNHANQFVDAVMLVCTCQRQASYLMAETSYKRRVIGDLAWALGVVPVKRPQDSALKGTGTVSIQLKKQDEEDAAFREDYGGDIAGEENTKSYVAHGINTVFTKELEAGDKIRPPGTPLALKIKEVVNDTTLIIDGGACGPKQVYEKVLEKLASGGAIGIFPEGGSHDRTSLLPLKVGVALIAYSALEKDGINVPVVPVGLNYFKAHRWRGRAVVEFGKPIRINPSTLGDYKAGGTKRRKVCNEFLDRVQDSMKTVIVSAPDYETLQLIHTARRLYNRRGQLQISEKQDLNRRFAEGYKRLLLMTDGTPPKEFLEIQEHLKAYQHELEDLGIRDYHVPTLSHDHADSEPVDGDAVLSYMKLVYQILHLLFLLLLAAVPSLLINLPVAVLAGMYSESRRKVLLAKSKVKVRAYDVVLTEKILFCIVMIPFLWIFLGLLMWHYGNMDGPTFALAILSLPLFAYTGIIVTEAGMVDVKDLRPYVMKLYPSTRKRLAALPHARKKLQKDLRRFIKKLGPVLGELYYKKDLDWGAIQEKARVAAETAEAAAPETRERKGSEVSDTLEIPEVPASLKPSGESRLMLETIPATIDALGMSLQEDAEEEKIEAQKKDA